MVSSSEKLPENQSAQSSQLLNPSESDGVAANLDAPEGDAALDNGKIKAAQVPEVIDVYMCDRCSHEKLWERVPEPVFEDDFNGKKLFQWKIQQIPKVKASKLVLSVGWGMMMAFLDMTIVSVSLFTMANYFNKSQTDIQWVVDGYSICLAAVSIIAGKIGDKFGALNVNHISMLLFMVFSVTCTLAGPNMFWLLVVSRLLQGMAASFLLSTTMAMSTTLVEPLETSRVMAWNGVITTFSTAFGPTIGGLMTESLGWQSIFLLNIPLGIVGMIVTSIFMPKMPRIFEKKFDWIGGILTFLFLALLVLGVAELIHAPTIALICLGVAVALIIGFCFWELHHPSPVFSKEVLFNVKVMSSLIGGIFNFATGSILSYQAPFLIQYAWGYSPSEAGLIAMPPAITSCFFGLFAGHLARKFSASSIRWGANVMSFIGLIVVSMAGILGPEVGLAIYILGAILVLGGMGSFVTASNTYIMIITPVNAKGSMGGAIQCFRETGFSLGVALGCVFNDAINSGMWGDDVPPMDNSMPEDYIWSFTHSFMFIALTFFVWVWIAALFTILAGFHEYEVEKGFKYIPHSIRAKLQLKVDECHAQGVDTFGRPWPPAVQPPVKPKKKRHFGRDPKRVAAAKAAKQKQSAEQDEE